MVCANDRSSSTCSGLRTMVTSGTSSSRQSLTSIWPIGCRRRMNESAMSLSPHRFDHSQHGERIDKRRRPLLGRCAWWQDEARRRARYSVLGVHGASGDSDSSSEERLRLRGVPSGYNDAGALVACGQRLADTAGQDAKRPVGQWRRDDGRSDVPPIDAEAKSAPASTRPKSDGLIGAASTRTRISPESREPRGTSIKESSSVPCSVTSERSSSELVGSGSVIVVRIFHCAGQPHDAPAVFIKTACPQRWQTAPLLAGGASSRRGRSAECRGCPTRRRN